MAASIENHKVALATTTLGFTFKKNAPYSSLLKLFNLVARKWWHCRRILQWILSFTISAESKSDKQQPSPLLYSTDIWPARNSRLTQCETNHYIARCTSMLAWSYLAGGSPEQLVIDLFAPHQRFAICKVDISYLWAWKAAWNVQKILKLINLITIVTPNQVFSIVAKRWCSEQFMQ